MDKSRDQLMLLKPIIHSDDRGWFYEAYNQKDWPEESLFIQDNHSYSELKGTIRGLHFQLPPYEQSKIVRVIKGSILDVVVDIRKDSPTYLKHSTYKLDSLEKNALYIPKGFAHGFITLEDETEVYYKVNQIYSNSHEVTVKYNDASLSINWPLFNKYILSNKDKNGLSLDEALKKLEQL